jgi:hypothetical protein
MAMLARQQIAPQQNASSAAPTTAQPTAQTSANTTTPPAAASTSGPATAPTTYTIGNNTYVLQPDGSWHQTLMGGSKGPWGAGWDVAPNAASAAPGFENATSLNTDYSWAQRQANQQNANTADAAAKAQKQADYVNRAVAQTQQNSALQGAPGMNTSGGAGQGVWNNANSIPGQGTFPGQGGGFGTVNVGGANTQIGGAQTGVAGLPNAVTGFAKQVGSQVPGGGRVQLGVGGIQPQTNSGVKPPGQQQPGTPNPQRLLAQQQQTAQTGTPTGGYGH